MGQERRRHQRVRDQRLIAHLHERGELVVCKVEDISAGGLFLKAPIRLSIGQVIALDLARPGLKKPLNIAGTVVSNDARRGGVGVRFDLDDLERTERLGMLLSLLGVVPERAAAPRAGVVEAPSGASPNEAKLMLQVRGLLAQIGDLHDRLTERDRTISSLVEDVARLEAELEAAHEHRCPTVAAGPSVDGPSAEQLDAFRTEARETALHLRRLLEATKKLTGE